MIASTGAANKLERAQPPPGPTRKRRRRGLLCHAVVTRGSCWISIVDRGAFEPVELNEGDIAVMPQGDPHALSSRAFKKFVGQSPSE